MDGEQGEKGLERKAGLEGPQISCMKFRLHPGDHEDSLPFFKYLFIYLIVPGLRCSMWDPVPSPGIEPRLPALGVQFPSHWDYQGSPSVF